MATDGIHVGDIGTKFVLTIQRNGVAIDMSTWTVTTKQIKFERPDGTTIEKDAEFDSDGSDGKIYALSVDGDLSQKGSSWKMQGYLVVTAPAEEVGTWHTEAVAFEVHDVIGSDA